MAFPYHPAEGARLVRRLKKMDGKLKRFLQAGVKITDREGKSFERKMRRIRRQGETVVLKAVKRRRQT